MERQKFEESLKAAFDQAEVSPSENAWINIELELEKAKGNKLKRRLLFYQMLAAASVVFAMGVSVGVYVYRPGATQQNFAFQEAGKINESMLQTPEATERSSQPEAEAPATSQALAAHESAQADREGHIESNRHENTGNAIAGRASEVAPAPGNTAQSREKRADGNKGNAGRYADSNNNANAITYTHTTPAVAATPQGRIAQGDDHGNAANHNNAMQALTSVVGDGEQGNVGAVVRPADPSIALPITATEGAYSVAVFSSITERKLPALIDRSQTGVALLPEKQEADPVALMLARLDKREQEVREETKEKKDHSSGEKLWTSIGVAAGSFNSVNTKGPDLLASRAMSDGVLSPASANASQSAADQEIKASGISYSMGINIGTRLSERWVFQGGLNYLTQSSDHTQNSMLGDANFTSLRPQSMKDVDRMTTEGALFSDIRTSVNTAPYNVNNNTRYLSVPMQAGYLIINRDFGFQLNAGVATDLFLQNTITATVDGETVDKTTEQSGKNSSFRQFNLSGLMGSELSYKFNRHYRISLNPGVRYPFGNIYKSDDYRATRLSFDVGLRFRYIFH